MPLTASEWPYPRWIAHRGAGTLAPENTLAALEMGWARGWRMFECDVKLSADGTPFLLHDTTLDRTTNANGPAHERPWHELAQLDAGRWHSPRFQGEPLPKLARIAQWCVQRGAMLNIEIKPAPGYSEATGTIVATTAKRLWAEAWAGGSSGPLWPLLTSFDVQALTAAQAAAPELPRGLLLNQLWPGAWDAASALGVVAVVAHHALWTHERIAWAQHLGWRTLAYTVNNPADAVRLLDWGLDGLITDRIDALGPGAVAARPPTGP